ncbi:MAG: ferritin [Saprospiraceae bacterium]|nr:ferritin [Saprospiraceae bacterium]
MLNKDLERALNEQILKEAEASFSYLSMAVWCDHKGLEGSARFFYRQANEERLHMMKLISYMLEMDTHPMVPSIQVSTNDFPSVQSIFERTLAQEQSVTQSIHNIITLANKDNDYATQNFLQWYVAEQREEESMIRKILDKINLIGEGPMTLYYIDKEMERINQEIVAQEGETPA